MTSFDSFWGDVAAGRPTVAFPFTIEGREGQGLVSATVRTSPRVFAALHAQDPGVRTRVLLSQMMKSEKQIRAQYPSFKVASS